MPWLRSANATSKTAFVKCLIWSNSCNISRFMVIYTKQEVVVHRLPPIWSTLFTRYPHSQREGGWGCNWERIIKAIAFQMILSQYLILLTYLSPKATQPFQLRPKSNGCIALILRAVCRSPAHRLYLLYINVVILYHNILWRLYSLRVSVFEGGDVRKVIIYRSLSERIHNRQVRLVPATLIPRL